MVQSEMTKVRRVMAEMARVISDIASLAARTEGMIATDRVKPSSVQNGNGAELGGEVNVRASTILYSVWNISEHVIKYHGQNCCETSTCWLQDQQGNGIGCT